MKNYRVSRMHTIVLLVGILFFGVASFASAAVTLTPLSTVSTGGMVVSIATRGHYAYAAVNQSIQVYDIASTTAPTLVRTYAISGYPFQITISGQYAYVSCQDAGLQIFDISNPTNLVLVGLYPANGGSIIGSTIVGNTAYVADNTKGLVVLDVSNPALPTKTGAYMYSSSNDGDVNVSIEGNYAYIASTYSGLLVLDVSNPAAPSFVGRYSVANPSRLDWLWDVAAVGPRAYLAYSFLYNGFQVVDITSPTTPTLLGSYDNSATGGAFLRVLPLNSTMMVVGDSKYGVRLMDVSSSSVPVLAASQWVGNDTYGAIAITGSNILAGGNGSLMLIHADGVSTQAPMVGNLMQYQEDGITPISSGSGFIGNAVTIKADVSDQDSTAEALQVEMKPAAQPFDGTNLTTSSTSTVASAPFATTTLSVTVDHLITPQGNVPADGIQQAFHWRVRAVDGEGNVSDWVTYGANDNSTDFTATYTLGQAAADLAKLVIHDSYLGDGKTWGGKGWDSNLRQYVSSDTIGSGYSFWNNSGQPPIGVMTGAGLDCSGLVEWSYNRSFDPSKSLLHNAVRWDGAGGQYTNNSTPTTQSALEPGDALFFGTGSGANVSVSHVAMYTGSFQMNDQIFDMVEAASPDAGIIPNTIANKLQHSGNIFLGYHKITIAPPIGGSVQAGSPINLTVTDPDGYTISATTSIQTDEELLREVPGQLYYSESELGSDGHPESVVYWPVSKAGAYKVKVTPMTNTTPSQTYSLSFTTGSSTIQLAQNIPLSQIPQSGYNVLVSSNGTPTLDTTPPEATMVFSTSTKSITVTGTDNLSTTTVTSSATSTSISDAAGNTLTLNTTQNSAQSNYAALTVRSMVYSSGTTTNATTSLRYFWLTDRTGKYTFLISAIKTPTDRLVSIYTSLTNKTYVVASQTSDDTDDLSLKTALLLLRQKIKTYNGSYIPSVSTHSGAVVIQ